MIFIKTKIRRSFKGATVLGEGIEAAGRSIGSVSRSTADDTAMSQRMVLGGQLPGGLLAPDLPAGPPPSRSTAAVAAFRNSISNSIVNSGSIVEEIMDTTGG